MDETVSIDSLLRFLRATPEQRAAVDRFLLGAPGELGGCGGPAKAGCEHVRGDVLLEAVLRVERKVEAITRPAAAQPAINQGEAQRIFAVLQRLRSKRAGMMAPLYDVFIATVLEGRSQRTAAKSCDCSPALLSKRVGELEKEFGLPLKQLQNYAKPLLEMETSVKGQLRRGQGPLLHERRQNRHRRPIPYNPGRTHLPTRRPHRRLLPTLLSHYTRTAHARRYPHRLRMAPPPLPQSRGPNVGKSYFRNHLRQGLPRRQRPLHPPPAPPTP